MKPIDSMIKECDEEASLPEAFVKKYMKYASISCVGRDLANDQTDRSCDLFLHH